MTVRPVLAAVSYVPHLPFPWGLVDFALRPMTRASDTLQEAVSLPNASGHLVRAPGVLPADGSRRVVLYLHGGAFLKGGIHSHARLASTISKFADSPVLVVNYRLVPKHTVGMALDDCHDAYRWLRLGGYDPEQIVLAGDSAGGYLALALAQRLRIHGEEPAALVAISPLLQLATRPQLAHPNIKADAMFPARAFDALVALVVGAAAKNKAAGKAEEIYEPLEHIEPGLPPTLIHVSGSEALLHDAQLAAAKLAAVGVPAEIHVWPASFTIFRSPHRCCPRRPVRYARSANTSERPPAKAARVLAGGRVAAKPRATVASNRDHSDGAACLLVRGWARSDCPTPYSRRLGAHRRRARSDCPTPYSRRLGAHRRRARSDCPTPYSRRLGAHRRRARSDCPTPYSRRLGAHRRRARSDCPTPYSRRLGAHRRRA
ncbi:alpha/beta hydrolase fold family protein [Mycobacterium kansasii 824]|nr:alpha/beta hydrolase fold family protein [Mycobacterium kansasii 824]